MSEIEFGIKNSGKLLTAKDISDNKFSAYHVSREMFSVGDIIDSNDWRGKGGHYIFFESDHNIPTKTLTCPDFIARRSVESQFELKRSQDSLLVPGRKTSVYCSLSIETAKHWASMPSRMGCQIYELQLSDEAKLVVLNYVWFNYAVQIFKGTKQPLGNNSSDEEVELSASYYWGGKQHLKIKNENKFELLFSGTAEVVRGPIKC
jgi:hypothetical protein